MQKSISLNTDMERTDKKAIKIIKKIQNQKEKKEIQVMHITEKCMTER